MNHRPKLTRTLVLVLATGAAVAGQATPAFGKSHVASGSFGGAGSGNGEFNEPFGIAVNDSTGRVYVADKGNDRVEYFSASGTYEGQFNGSDAPRGPFSGPTAVAVNQSDGDVWVADSGNNVVDEFKEAGGYVEGSQLTGPSGPNATISDELFANPDGVAVDPNNGDVYIAEKNERNEASEKGPVSVFEPSGGLITQFDSQYRPGSLAIDSNSNVYVAEPGAGQVDKYSAFGASHLTNYLGVTEFIVFTSATEAPRAVATDLSDNEVYTAANIENAKAEEEGGLVNAYDSSGRLIESFGAGHFAAAGVPNSLRGGIAVNSSSHTVYVPNPAGKDVDIFVQVEGPTATTEEPATEVTATSATVPGEVNPNEALLTECLFEYGTAASYGQSKTCTQTLAEIGSGNAPKAVSAHLTGLIPNEIYHYQLFAANASAPGRGGDQTFQTEAAPPAVNDSPPVVSATRTTARFSGTVNPENSSTEYDFQYVRAAEYEPSASDPYSAGAETPKASAGGGFGDRSVGFQTIVELQPETTYDYRLVGSNQAGAEPGPDYTFTTTSRTPPLVDTGGASGVTQTNATISGVLDPQGIETSYAFEVGTDTTYSGAKVFGDAGQGEGAEAITVALEDLAPGTTYHYRLAATNADGSSYGRDMTFTTPGAPSPILQPLTSPLIATPAIAFPAGSQANTGTTGTKNLTRAQKLAAALRTCRTKTKGKRVGCERRARKQYASVKAGAKRKHKVQH